MLKNLVILLAITLTAPAAQVQFSSSLFSVNLNSAGNPLTSDWVFALGAFDPNFTPTADNRDLWAEHWTTARTSAYNATQNFFAAEFQFSTNAAPFTTSNQGYIWGYNCHGDWIMVTNPTWKWPVADLFLGLPTSWTISASTQTIVGAVNNGSAHITTESGGAGFDIPPFSFTDWQSSHFTDTELADPEIAGENADPDGDGHPNLIEYAQGTNPRDQKSTNRGKIIFLEENGILFPALEFTISNKIAEVTVTVATSTNLVDWELAVPLTGSDPLKSTFRSTNSVATTPRSFFKIQTVRN